MNTLRMIPMILWFLLLPVTAAAQSTRLPVIHQIGAIPARFEGDEIDSALKQRLNNAFSSAVRDARRFRVLDDDLVGGLWNTPKGRSELVSQFELHAFASMNIAARGETTIISTRLLSPDLAVWLLESESITSSTLAMKSTDELLEFAQNLLFRLFNRIPADVSVTSVQGTFVTVSGGEEQGIRLEDEITLARYLISSRHPANNTWLSFHEQVLAKAKIVEVKKYTAVARLTSMVREGAVEVGDGARIPAISGRARFARLNQKPVFAETGAGGSVIVPPVFQEGVPRPKPAKEFSDPANAAQKNKEQNDHTVGEVGSEPKEKSPAVSAEGPKSDDKTEENDGFLAGGVSFDKITKNLIEEVTVRFGAHTWDVSGPVSAEGKFPLWLVNRLGFDVKRSLFMNLKIGFGGGIGFGQTGKGNYVGYDANGRIFWEQEFPEILPFIKTWRAGGEGMLTGLSVTNELYGGGDFVQGGGFAGIAGQINWGDSPERYDWYSEFAVLPLNVGRMGYDKKMHSVESSFGWDFRLGGFRQSGAPRGEIEWGAATSFGSTKVTLSNGRRPQENHFTLMGLARYRM